MAEQKVESGRIATGAVTGDKVADNAIRGNNIVAGTITGNLIASQTITGDDLDSNIIRGNNIVAGTITGNLIGIGAVSGNQITTGAVSSNNISANIQFNSSRIVESVNVSTIAASGNVNIDVSNATVHYFTANATANVTFNLRGNSGTTLNSILANGQSVSVAIGFAQGATQYAANLHIDGVLQTSNIRWMGNVKPAYTASITNALTDFYSITAIKLGTDSYTILASNTIFGYNP